MKKELGILVYVVEILFFSMLIYLKIDFNLRYVINKDLFHPNIMDDLMYSNIFFFVSYILLRFGLLPVKLYSRINELSKYHKVMNWVILVMTISFVVAVGVTISYIKESNPLINEVKSDQETFIFWMLSIYMISAFFVYYKDYKKDALNP
ncbi:hypothetical protein JV173_05935 [Acholeplasma equirhinis]|uniref:hypothetical protein n=1 Tax=Acholeplasma equirhinis TaxID=555393 RepID=UPI00197AEBB0|nr:hypothetical protein [Acholeplasma equirhinis]MBN3491055.1 hypothetical protein [Acholeplasma equirhinis]